jgi:hypothetical protein
MRPGVLTVMTAFLSVVGCATYGYHVDRDEARRVVEEIRERTDVVVTATRVDSSERVRLRLSRTDQVSLVTRSSTGSVSVKGPDQLVNLATDSATVDAVDFWETRRGGWAALAIGAPLTAIAVVIGGAFATWTAYGFAAVPVIGPTAYAIDRSEGKILLLSAFQAVPIGLLIGGILASRPTHEVAGDTATPADPGKWHFVTATPIAGGGSVQVMGTF